MHGENNRILIIDDTPGIHEDFRKVLNGAGAADDLDMIMAEVLGEEQSDRDTRGFSLDSAYQGQEGYAKVCDAVTSDQPYAMAFVDIRMPPGWDGIETIERIWEADPRVEVVICSAYSDYSWDDIVSRLGKCDQFLVLKKPFEGMEVTQIAHALTRKWTAQRSAQMRAEELAGLVKDKTRELEGANHQLAREIQEREQMEGELRLAQKLEAVGQLAAGIAHEINTPMQYIGDNTHFLERAFGNFVEVLDAFHGVVHADGDAERLALLESAKAVAERTKVDYLKKRVPRALARTIEGVETVSRIVRAMKDFSHMGSDDLVPTDINHAIEATVAVSKNEWKYVADIETELDPDLPLVPCIGGEINQVFLNIVVNAAHAIADQVDASAAERGKISIRTHRANGHALVSITDTGGGIPETIQTKIFDPFFTTKEVGRGTGQGLAIARNIIVEKHSGSLTFETKLGEGTTFNIQLPIENAGDG